MRIAENSLRANPEEGLKVLEGLLVVLFGCKAIQIAQVLTHIATVVHLQGESAFQQSTRSKQVGASEFQILLDECGGIPSGPSQQNWFFPKGRKTDEAIVLRNHNFSVVGEDEICQLEQLRYLAIAKNNWVLADVGAGCYNRVFKIIEQPLEQGVVGTH